jgi:hypothetical protein
VTPQSLAANQDDETEGCVGRDQRHEGSPIVVWCVAGCGVHLVGGRAAARERWRVGWSYVHEPTAQLANTIATNTTALPAPRRLVLRENFP